MFDSPLHDWMPGKPVLFGFPYHGRVDFAVGGSSSILPTVRLPNGSILNLPRRPTGGAASFLTGQVLRFRDPRAKEVERSAEDQAADRAAGREWRPDALYHPGMGWVQGRPVSSQDFFIYHDGAKNWMAEFSATKRLVAVPTISRRSQPEIIYYDVEYPAGGPDQSQSFNLIDALPDGSKAIFATVYRTPKSDDIFGDYDAACFDHPVAFWELSLSQKDGVYRGVMRPLRTVEQTAGTVYSEAYPRLPRKRLDVSVVWTETGVDEAGNHLYQGSAELYTEQLPETGTGGQYGSYSVRHGFERRTVGMFYGPDQVARCIYMDVLHTSSINRSIEGSVQSSPAKAKEMEITEQGSITFTYTRNITSTIQTRHRVYTDSDTCFDCRCQSTLTSTEQGVYQHEYARTQAPPLKDKTLNSSVSVQSSIVVDGISVFDDSSAWSVDALGPIPTESPATITVDSELGLGAVTFVRADASKAGAASFRLARYTPTMIAGLVSYKREGGAYTSIIGNASTPYPGRIAYGRRTFANGVGFIYGSYNPVTGQVLRDTPSPVSWI